MATSTEWEGLALANGRYVITAKLGEGGMGSVFRAMDRNIEADVVIKIPHRAMMDDPEFASRFTREIRSLVRLSHPHIVKVSDVGAAGDGAPFAVMQFLSGGSLEDRRPVGPTGKPLPCDPKKVPRWLEAVAGALDYIHSQGYVHRDVKPGNILFDALGHAFLSDFGVAKVLASAPDKAASRTAMTGAGMVLGTPEYMAPELIMGEPFDGRVDQYALAVTVYELLCGRRPFEDEAKTKVLVLQTTKAPPRLTDWAPDLPERLSKAVLRGLSKNPDERYVELRGVRRSGRCCGGRAPAVDARVSAHRDSAEQASTRDPTSASSGTVAISRRKSRGKQPTGPEPGHVPASRASRTLVGHAASPSNQNAVAGAFQDLESSGAGNALARPKARSHSSPHNGYRWRRCTVRSRWYWAWPSRGSGQGKRLTRQIPQGRRRSPLLSPPRPPPLRSCRLRQRIQLSSPNHRRPKLRTHRAVRRPLSRLLIGWWIQRLGPTRMPADREADRRSSTGGTTTENPTAKKTDLEPPPPNIAVAAVSARTPEPTETRLPRIRFDRALLKQKPKKAGYPLDKIRSEPRSYVGQIVIPSGMYNLASSPVDHPGGPRKLLVTQWRIEERTNKPLDVSSSAGSELEVEPSVADAPRPNRLGEVEREGGDSRRLGQQGGPFAGQDRDSRSISDRIQESNF